MFGKGPALFKAPRIVIDSGTEFARMGDVAHFPSDPPAPDVPVSLENSYLVRAQGNCLAGIPEGTYIRVAPFETLEPLCLCVFALKGDPAGRGKLFLGHFTRLRVEGRVLDDVVVLAQSDPAIVFIVRRHSLSALHRAVLPAETGLEHAEAMVGFAIGGYSSRRKASSINPTWRPPDLRMPELVGLPSTRQVLLTG